MDRLQELFAEMVDNAIEEQEITYNYACMKLGINRKELDLILSGKGNFTGDYINDLIKKIKKIK